MILYDSIADSFLYPEYQIHNKLQPRILKKGELKPPDYDMFVQCYSCGNIFPIYEAHYESEIR